MRTRRLTLTLVLPSLLGGVLAGCGNESSTPSDRPVAVGSAPNSSAVLTTRTPVTVIEGPDQPTELCLGGVAESYPPQCGGPELVGFDWAEHEGDFEEASGVRWGEFLVEGTYDGTRFTVSRVVPADEAPAPPEPGDDDAFDTPCPEPDGGWRVLDEGRTTERTMERTFVAAEKLPGYADAWMDQSRNPRQDDEFAMNDPEYVTINVRVTKDRAGAEAALREIWGGALCVSGAKHTDAELRRIQEEVNDLPGMTSSGSYNGVVQVQVEYDDGTLQEQVDAKYGTGLVVVSSALVPVD